MIYELGEACMAYVYGCISRPQVILGLIGAPSFESIATMPKRDCIIARQCNYVLCPRFAITTS